MKNLTINDLGLGFNKNLKKYNYILQPQFCNCCGEQKCPQLETKEDVYDFLMRIMFDVECDRVMGIAFKRDGKVLVLIKWNDEIISLKENMKFDEFKKEMGDLIKEMHCIGAIQEVKKGSYRIIHNGIR